MLDEWPVRRRDRGAAAERGGGLCAELSARDDLRRAPDVIDAALELLQKWLRRRRAGAAAISFVTRADAGADGQREFRCASRARLAEPLPAGDEVPATLSLLRSGRKSLLIEDGGFIASHFGRAAKRRLGTDCRGVTCALVALGDDEASRCGVIEVLERATARPRARKPPRRICGGRLARARRGGRAVRGGAPRCDRRWRPGNHGERARRLAARNVAAATKPADAGDGDGDGDAPADDGAPVDAPKAAAAAAAAALSDKLVVQERRNLVLRQLGAESARWAALPSEVGAPRAVDGAAGGSGDAYGEGSTSGCATARPSRRRCGASAAPTLSLLGMASTPLSAAVSTASCTTRSSAAAPSFGPPSVRRRPTRARRRRRRRMMPAAALARRAARRRRTATPRRAARRRRARARRVLEATLTSLGGLSEKLSRRSSRRRLRRRSTLRSRRRRRRPRGGGRRERADGRLGVVADGEYYWHPATGAVRWEPPPAADGSGGWQQLRDEEGNIYFWNREPARRRGPRPTERRRRPARSLATRRHRHRRRPRRPRRTPSP